MPDDSVLVCRRCADLPEPPVASDLWDCEICQRPIWVAKSSPKGVQHTWCMQCAVLAIGDDADVKIAEITDDQLSDISRYFNRVKP